MSLRGLALGFVLGLAAPAACRWVWRFLEGARENRLAIGTERRQMMIKDGQL